MKAKAEACFEKEYMSHGLHVHDCSCYLLPLGWAVRRGDRAVVELILQSSQTNINCIDYVGGTTALEHALKERNDELVEVLLRTDKVMADLNGEWGCTPPSKAAYNEYEAVVRLLLRTGKVEADSKNITGVTPLSKAACYGHEAVVKLLLETGQVEADSKDSFNYTPLMKAVENEHEAVAKLLRHHINRR